MKIIFAASECVPFSKTGGLADVIGALPQALAELGHTVSVYLPLYRSTRKLPQLAGAKTVLPSITIPFDDRHRFCSVRDAGKHSGVQFYFIDYPEFFDREHLYGESKIDYPDNAERFALYSRAVLEASKILGVPDVFHCHDWQAALLPVLLRTHYADDPLLGDAASVFTIHNMAFQGLFHRDTVAQLLLPWELFTMEKMEFWGKLNFVKGALVFSDYLTTVSPTYSREIQEKEQGAGLDGVLREHYSRLCGILNGVDYKIWNPAIDGHIAARFSPDNLEGKKECRRDLLQQFDMPDRNPEWPVVGIVSRLTEQKGWPLLEETESQLLRLPLMLTVLGSGDSQYEDFFLRLSKQSPAKFGVKIGFDDKLAHKIEAGSDMFLMPSHFEPCGLNQMYSLKYGTAPIVRAAGGLNDTVDPWEPGTGRGTGFKFSNYTGQALLATLEQALQAFKDKERWKKLMLNGMAKDFSWSASAREYVEIYERLKPPEKIAKIG